jgi:hypothetical protein
VVGVNDPVGVPVYRVCAIRSSANVNVAASRLAPPFSETYSSMTWL